MSRRLAFTVFVTDPDSKRTVGLVAGTIPPDWAAPLIRNPRAWAPEVESPVAEPEPEPVSVIDADLVATRPEADVDQDTYDADASMLGQKPLDTVAEIKAWVGDDPARASDALGYETDVDDPRPGSGQNRVTLIAALAAVIG